MSNNKDECCTPKGQVPRYVDCVGCDKKPIEGATLSYAQAQKDSFKIMEKKQSSVEQVFSHIKASRNDIQYWNDSMLVDWLLEQEDRLKAMHNEECAEVFKEAQECAVKHDGVYFKYNSIEDYYKSKETELESLPCELESLSNIKQHEVTWIAALDYAIEKMKGLNNAESIDAFKKHYNETFGGQDNG